jgi:hypothetical protein
MDLQWQTGKATSCFLDLQTSMLSGRTGDAELDERWQPHKHALCSLLDSEAIAPSSFLAVLVPLSARYASPRDLADACLRRLIGREKAQQHFARVAGHLTDFTLIWEELSGAVGARLEEARQRGMEQWVTFARPIVFRTAELTEKGLLPEDAAIFVVTRRTGLSSNSYEAWNMVLWSAEEEHEEGETELKLAWLVCRLNQDLPRYSENLRHESRGIVPSLALVPAVLAAQLDASYDPHEVPAALIESTINRWNPELKLSERTAEKLARWWQTYCHQRPDWSVALLGLDRLLYASEAAVADIA